jgi:hypothetical protein
VPLRGVSSLRSRPATTVPVLLGGVHLRMTMATMARPASLLSSKRQGVPPLMHPPAHGPTAPPHSLPDVGRRLYSTAPASASSPPDVLPSGARSAIKDPSHPHLYYHPLLSSSPSSSSGAAAPPARLALSFLPEEPAPGSRTVIGWIPANGGILYDFKENHAFRWVRLPPLGLENTRRTE